MNYGNEINNCLGSLKRDSLRSCALCVMRTFFSYYAKFHYIVIVLYYYYFIHVNMTACVGSGIQINFRGHQITSTTYILI